MVKYSRKPQPFQRFVPVHYATHEGFSEFIMCPHHFPCSLFSQFGANCDTVSQPVKAGNIGSTNVSVGRGKHISHELGCSESSCHSDAIQNSIFLTAAQSLLLAQLHRYLLSERGSYKSLA
ncbi:hypothetical protein GWK47_003426 [Chionoecetes opilio]|uniref:Uncharacterized protein n=1 Tax=Chionoecetes opilio TaxID=41210 RepID=A0A8J4YS60_CHIOP|nr:hypothetical protein GWK47_003426 [Chionoecetes opilio]